MSNTITLTLDQFTQAQSLNTVVTNLERMLTLLQQVDKYKDLLGKATGNPQELVRLTAELARLEKQVIALQREEEKLRAERSKADAAASNAAAAASRAADQQRRAAESAARAEEKKKRELAAQSGIIGRLQDNVRRLNQLQRQATTPEQIERVNRMLEQQRNRLRELQQAGRQNTNTFGNALNSFQFKFNFLGNSLAEVASNTVGALKDIGAEAIQMSLRAEGIRTAFDRLNNPGLLDELRTATQGTVSDLGLMTSAVKAANFKLPMDQLATYLKFAQQRALETGESVDYLVESIVTGISRKSIPIMDNLGISATELNTEFKKTGDFAKAAANIIDREMKNAGGAIDNSATKVQRISASWENFKLVLGDFLVDVGAGLLDWFDVLSGKMSVAEMASKNMMSILQKAAGEQADQQIKSVKALSKTKEEELETVKDLIKNYSALRTQYDKQYDAHTITTEGYVSQVTYVDALLKKLNAYKKALSTPVTAPPEEKEKIARDYTELENRIRLIQDARKRELAEAELSKQKEIDIANEKGYDKNKILEYYRIKALEINEKYDKQERQERLSENQKELEFQKDYLDAQEELRKSEIKKRQDAEQSLSDDISKALDERAIAQTKNAQERINIEEKIAIADFKAKNDGLEDEEDYQLGLRLIREKYAKLREEDQKEEDKKLKEQRQQMAEQIVSQAIDGINTRRDAQISAIDDEIERQREAVAQQRELANQGASNSLAAEEQRLAELERKKAEAQKRQERLQKIETYYNLLSSYAKDDPKTAPQKALVQMAIAEGIAAAFLEKGGIVGDSTETTQIGGLGLSRSHKDGNVLAVLSPNEGVLSANQIQALGGKDGFYSLQKMLDNPNSDSLFEKQAEPFTHIVAASQPVDMQPVISELKAVKDAIRKIPGNSFAVDEFGNLIHTIVKDGNREVINKGKFVSPKRKRFL